MAGSRASLFLVSRCYLGRGLRTGFGSDTAAAPSTAGVRWKTETGLRTSQSHHDPQQPCSTPPRACQLSWCFSRSLMLIPAGGLREQSWWSRMLMLPSHSVLPCRHTHTLFSPLSAEGTVSPLLLCPSWHVIRARAGLSHLFWVERLG